MTKEEMRAMIEQAAEITGDERTALITRIIDEAFAVDAGGQLRETLEKLESMENSSREWEGKYNEMQGRYRELSDRYRERFMSAGSDDTTFLMQEESENITPKELKFEDLFVERKDD